MPIRSTPAAVLHSPNVEADRYLPEGPRTTTIDGRPALVWVNIQRAGDIASGDIHVRFWDNGEHRTYPQPRRPGFQFPTDRPNTLLVGMEKEVGLLDLATNQFTPLGTIPDANPRTIINDGEIVPGGRAIVFGTKDVRFADKIAQVYLFTLADRKLSVLADGHLCSNGKVIRDSFVFDIDTPRQNVIRYRLDMAGRRWTDETVVLDVKGCPGFPDGMVDAGNGSAIIAFYNPDSVSEGRAIRFDLNTGAQLEEWTTPASPRVTCPHLVERDGRVRLILTTAVEGMTPELRAASPNAGSLFVAETDLRLVPASEIVRVG